MMKITVPIDKRVDTPQRAQLQSLLDKYQDVFKNQPGRTSLTEHRIITGDAHPIRGYHMLTEMQSEKKLARCSSKVS